MNHQTRANEPVWGPRPGGKFEARWERIVAIMQLPVKHDNASSGSRQGRDIRQHKTSFYELCAEIEEQFHLDLQDWRTRRDTRRPEKRLEDNWVGQKDPPYDYGKHDAWEGDPIADWDAWYQEHYAQAQANPGKTRATIRLGEELAITPLYGVYYALRRWWMSTFGTRGYSPTFKNAYTGGELELDYCNPQARLFGLVAEWLDRRYTLANCASVHQGSKNSRLRSRAAKPA